MRVLIDPKRPWWFAPLWIHDELKAARLRLGAVRRAHERLQDKSTDYAKSMEVTARVRAKVVALLEAELAAVEAEKGGG